MPEVLNAWKVGDEVRAIGEPENKGTVVRVLGEDMVSVHWSEGEILHRDPPEIVTDEFSIDLVPAIRFDPREFTVHVKQIRYGDFVCTARSAEEARQKADHDYGARVTWGELEFEVNNAFDSSGEGET